MNAAQKINSVYSAQVPGDWIEVHLGIDGDRNKIIGRVSAMYKTVISKNAVNIRS